MTTYNLARAAAIEFNTKHGGEYLVARDVSNVLTAAEILEYGQTARGLMLAGQVVTAIRGRPATHGETIAAGRLLGDMNYPRHKIGPRQVYLLDNAARSGAN